jgi:hypothetical protein
MLIKVMKCLPSFAERLGPSPEGPTGCNEAVNILLDRRRRGTLHVLRGLLLLGTQLGWRRDFVVGLCVGSPPEVTTFTTV